MWERLMYADTEYSKKKDKDKKLSNNENNFERKISNNQNDPERKEKNYKYR